MEEKKGASLIAIAIILLIVIAIGIVIFVVINNNKTNDVNINEASRSTSNNTNTTSNQNKNTNSTSKSELVYNSTDAFDYEEVEGGIIITHFKNYDYTEYDKIYVPNSIDGKTVVGIGSLDSKHRVFGAIFGKCEVIIPNTVKHIAGMAFNGAKGLVKLSGGENCKTIGEYAFMNCENLSEITFINNVTDLANNAFAGCTSWNANH